MDRNARVKAASEEAVAKEISARNHYYRDASARMIRIIKIQALFILIFAAGFSFYINTHENADRFFAQTFEGRTMELVGLNLPNMGKGPMDAWVAQAATQILTFGFSDVDEKFSVSRLNFTPDGWESFYTAMQKSPLLDSVFAAQQLVTSVPAAPPTLTYEGLIEGVYTWSYTIDMLITFRSGNVKKTSHKMVFLKLQPVPTTDNPHGIGISEWVMP